MFDKIMTDKYNGLANHLVRRYDIPPRDIWISLTPGSNTYKWIKMDKSHFNTPCRIAGYIIEPVIDAVKTAFYTGIAFGLVRAINEVVNSPVVKNSLDNLF